MSLCGPEMNWRLVQGVTLCLPDVKGLSSSLWPWTQEQMGIPWLMKDAALHWQNINCPVDHVECVLRDLCLCFFFFLTPVSHLYHNKERKGKQSSNYFEGKFSFNSDSFIHSSLPLLVPELRVTGVSSVCLQWQKENPRRHSENMRTPHRTAPGPGRNPPPSCCGAPTTAPPCRPQLNQ